MPTYFSDSIRNTTFTATDLGTLLDSLACGVETWGGVSTGSANVHAITVSPTPVAYANGQTFNFYAGYTNTGSATLNVNSLGAITLYNAHTGAVLVGYEMFATGVCNVVYYNTKFYLINPRPSFATWVPTLVGFTLAPSNTSYTYSRDGNQCTLYLREGTAGTATAVAALTYSLPFTAATVSNAVWGTGSNVAYDNSALKYTVAAYVSSGGTVLNISPDSAGTSWNTAASGYRLLLVQLTYTTV